MPINMFPKLFRNHLLLLLGVCLISHKVSFSQPSINPICPEPIPTWVKSYPKPTLEKNYSKDIDLVLVHNEMQYNNITTQRFSRHLFYINTIEGLNNFDYYNIPFTPDYETIQIHNATIYRNKEKISLQENLYTRYIYSQKQIDGDFYSDYAKMQLFINKLKVGDLLEITYSRTGIQPDIGNYLMVDLNVHPENLIGKTIVRLLNHPDKTINYKALNFEANLISKSTSEYTIMELEYTNKSAVKTTEIRNPIPNWFETDKIIYFTDLCSWEEGVALNYKNHQLNIKATAYIHDFTKQLIQGVTKKTDQIKTILDYIQDEIEYLDYGLIEPKPPETVIKQQYGDCKSKSLLAIKMLETIGIKAWPVIVRLGGLDDRYKNSNNIVIFDHEIIEFVVQEDTLLYDLTKDLQHGDIYQSNVSDFRYGLRIIPGTDKLTKLKHKKDSKISFDITIVPTLDKGIYKIENKIHFYGTSANDFIALYKSRGIKGVNSQLMNYQEKNFLCHTSEDFYKYDFTYSKDKPQAVLYQQYQHCRYYQDEFQLDIPVIQKYIIDFKYRIPYQSGDFIFTPNFNETEILYKIIPSSDTINFTPDTLMIENDCLIFTKRTWMANDTVYAYYYANTLQTHFSDERIEDFNILIDSIYQQLDIFLDDDSGYATVILDNTKKFKNNTKTIIASIFVGCFLLTLILWGKKM